MTKCDQFHDPLTEIIQSSLSQKPQIANDEELRIGNPTA
jgi:hypothetical protein